MMKHVRGTAALIRGNTHDGGHVAFIDAGTDNVTFAISVSDDTANLVGWNVACIPLVGRINRTLVDALVDGAVAVVRIAHRTHDAAQPTGTGDATLDGHLFDGGVPCFAKQSLAGFRRLVDVQTADGVTRAVEDAFEEAIAARTVADRSPLIVFVSFEIDIRGQAGASRNVARLTVGADNDVSEHLQLGFGTDQIRIARRAATGHLRVSGSRTDSGKYAESEHTEDQSDRSDQN